MARSGSWWRIRRVSKASSSVPTQSSLGSIPAFQIITAGRSAGSRSLATAWCRTWWRGRPDHRRGQMKALNVVAGVVLAGWATAANAAQPTPLFASDAPIQVTIRGPMGTLASNRAEVPRPATMIVDGVTYPITLSPRGITRKTNDICDFPPLRVTLTQAAPPGSLFQHQRRLKLVTHCKRSADFQQKVLLEYSAYRIFNLMTPLSFRARLANIDYVDDSGHPYLSRVGYFIEDFSDVAKRNGMTQAHMPSMIAV